MPSMDRPYRLIILDWDGTVVASIGSIVACARQAMQDLGLPPAAEAAVAETIGLALPEIAMRLLGNHDGTVRTRWVERYRVLWLSRFRHRVTPIPGASEAIDALADAGYWLAVATGKGRVGLERDLESTGLAPRFRALRTADDGPSKPHPGMLLSLLEELAVPANEALMVGDSTVDLEMARAARMAAVGVTSGSLSRAQLEPWGPCLESVRELPAWLAARQVP